MLTGMTQKQIVLLTITAVGALIAAFGRLWLWGYALDYTTDRSVGLMAIAFGAPTTLIAAAILIRDIWAIEDAALKVLLNKLNEMDKEDTPHADK